MSTELQKFWEKVKADKDLQQKLGEAFQGYTGEQTEKAVFENVVVPFAKEQGFAISIEDNDNVVKELSPDEMEQVAGGFWLPGFGGGLLACDVVGAGVGSAYGIGSAGGCCLIGIGSGFGACAGVGITATAEDAKSPNAD